MSSNVVGIESGYAVVRRWVRYKLDVPLRVIAYKDDRVSIVQGRGHELNEGGMMVFAGAELAAGAVVALEFTPPYTGLPIRVRCLVRNRSGYHYGVEFVQENGTDESCVEQIRVVLKAMGSRTQ